MKLRGLVARKIGMTRVVTADGQMVPVTLLQVTTQKVTKLLSTERDGYAGFQVGYKTNAEHRINKPDLARLRKAGVVENFTRFKEFRAPEGLEESVQVGTDMSLSLLEGIELVDIAGITKGHGFEGAPSRHGHKTGRETHGSRHHRRPGSLGMRTSPGRVFKGKKMPGHMGHVIRTTQNLRIIEIDHELNVVAVKGSVPGHKDGFVFIKPASKRPSSSQKA